MSCGGPHETPCAEVIDKVYEFIDGELDQADHRLIRQHLDECGPCLREYGLEEAVKALVRRSCCDEAPDGLREKVLYKLAVVRVELQATE